MATLYRARGRWSFYAQEEAQKFGEGYVSTEHLLLGLVRESDSVAARVLEKPIHKQVRLMHC